MKVERLSIPVHTQYAELLQQLVAAEARGVTGSRTGSLVTKELRGRRYWYLQVREAAKQRQVYLGPDGDGTRAIVERFERMREQEVPLARERERLVAALVAGGALGTSAAETKVIAMLAAAGLFRLGAQVIRTHAFVVYANMFGVRWTGDTSRTADIDIAHDPRLSIALAEPGQGIDLSAELSRGAGELRFWPVPQLSHKQPSTSFRVAGRNLVLELLTPLRGKASGKPVLITALHAAAQPLPYLDYLLEGPERAVVLGGDGVLINVPDPARFALHKLIVAAVRPASSAAKARKDLQQAALLLDLLVEERPGSLSSAWDALTMRGRGWLAKVRASMSRLPDALRERLAAREIR
jgi:hypothetical protein